MAVYIGCTPDRTDAPIPTTIFPRIIVPLNLPENIALRSEGNYKELREGVRGIILYSAGNGVFLAYERNCSFQPNDACATVNVDLSRLYMIDPCCNSTFNFEDGYPTGGVAWRPLRQYQATYDGSNVVITDNIVVEP